MGRAAARAAGGRLCAGGLEPRKARRASKIWAATCGSWEPTSTRPRTRRARWRTARGSRSSRTAPSASSTTATARSRARLAEQLDEPPAAVVVPVGNGALVGGIGIEAVRLWPGCQIVAVAAREAPVMADSWEAGYVVTSDRSATFADGMAVRVAIPLAVDVLGEVVTPLRDRKRARDRGCGRRARGGRGSASRARPPLRWPHFLSWRTWTGRSCSSSPGATSTTTCSRASWSGRTPFRTERVEPQLGAPEQRRGDRLAAGEAEHVSVAGVARGDPHDSPARDPTSGRRSSVKPMIPAQRCVIGGVSPSSSARSASSPAWIGAVVASSSPGLHIEVEIAPAPGDEPPVGELLDVVVAPPPVQRARQHVRDAARSRRPGPAPEDDPGVQLREQPVACSRQ